MLTCSSITTPRATLFPQFNCITSHSLKQLKPTHLLKPHVNPKPALFYFNLYLQLYANAGFMKKARGLFESMPERTLISWTILMSGYAKHGPGKEALALFKDMLSADKTVRPDSYVYAVVLRSCGETRELEFGRGVHGQVLKKGEAFLDGFLQNSLVNIVIPIPTWVTKFDPGVRFGKLGNTELPDDAEECADTDKHTYPYYFRTFTDFYAEQRSY
ncbi:hypothetical protein F3Y22_tig00110893pilonHSYRG01015 [Hibiscus syriacus]|uniref:Pentatricopeptide repeat-containing protein n=1 Tax=Hibiscus syriacus TaxID=106335 RepID=A0A6A2ZGF6_HIBSY|nr:hypothetical protein F3Y22_tig00110893pilonHSYRG01015 [Hibiscus syriacus]